MDKSLIVIAGPTAIGKTALSIEIAHFFQTEIVSADSRQFYDEIGIGTAKPSAKELSACKHHFIGHISIKEPYTAAQYEKDAMLCCTNLFEKHDTVVLTGGSGLYIDALCNGFDEAPASDEKIRNELQTLFETNGIEALQKLLTEIDPDYAQQVDMQNPQRLMRAIEINRLIGKNMKFVRKGKRKQRPFGIIKICLRTNRVKLYENINKRVDHMIDAGLEDEALSVYHQRNLNALQTVGYKEFFDYFDGKMSHAETVDKIKQHSRNYAKRQLTWFRRDTSYHWFDYPEQKKLIIPFIQQQLSLSDN